MKRRSIVLLPALLLTAALFSACSASEEDIQGLVQGNLDVIYLDTVSESFQKSANITEEEGHQTYEAGLLSEADFGAGYLNMDLETAAAGTADKLCGMYDRIYSFSKYEVGEAVKDGDGWTVPVTVYPMNVFQVLAEDYYPEWYETVWSAQDFSEMTEEEFETAWAEGIIGLTDQIIDDGRLGYLDPVTVSVSVQKDDTGTWSIAEGSISDIDAYIIQY